MEPNKPQVPASGQQPLGSAASTTPPQPVQPATGLPSSAAKPNPQPAKPPRKLGGAKALLSVIVFIAGVVIAATLINQFVFQSYYVDGTSMTPTLQNDDRLIIDKVERTGALIGGHNYIPKRGQIVVLDSSLIDQSGHNEQLIKRIIGLPGETVRISSDGQVTISNKDNPNGFNVDESLGLHLEPTYVDSPQSVTLSDNQVFVMGDNRAPGGSFDSRSFGPVESNKIQGRLLARIFPLNHTQLF